MKNLEFGWKELVITILLVTTTSLSVYIYNQDKIIDEEVKEDEKVTYIGFNKKGLAYNLDNNNYNKITKAIEYLDKGDNDSAKNNLKDLIEEDLESEITNFTRSDAVESLKEILASVGEDANSKDRSIEERMKLLDNEETDIKDVLSEETIDSLYFSEDFGNVKFNRQFAASSMLAFHNLINENSESDEFSPLSNSYDEIVYLDNRFLTAHIPLDLFIGNNTGVAFEMQYVNGEWKLNPYTAMMSLNLMGLLSESEDS